MSRCENGCKGTLFLRHDEKRNTTDGLMNNNLVGEHPGCIACGAVPSRDGRQGDGLYSHIAGSAVEMPCGKRPYFGYSKPCRAIRMEGVDQMPLLPIGGDVVVDSLRKEYPREGIVEEVELDFMQTLAAAKVDDCINGVTTEA